MKVLARCARERRAARTLREAGKRLHYYDLVVEPARHRVYVNGKELPLRPLEFRLLATLLENVGRLFSRAELLEHVWGVGGISLRAVDTTVRRLRERLGPYGFALETVQGAGYRLREPAPP